MDKYFLTSRYSNDIYKLIVDACFKDFKKNNKNKKLKILKIEITNNYDFGFLLYFFLMVFSNIFNLRKKIIYKKYKNVNYGRYLTAYTLRDVKCYESNFFFYKNLLINAFVVSKYFYAADKYLKICNSKSLYLDHCMYLNGIFYEYFRDNEYTIYTNNYPQDLIRINLSSFKINFDDALRIKKTKKKLNKFQIKKTRLLTKKILKNSGSLANWMNWLENNFKKINYQNLNSYDYIIYVHAFGDAQLGWGVDGFVSAYDWLKFTIQKLTKKNKKVLVKAHPNFFLKRYKYFGQEKKIFNNLVEEYKNNKNIFFINDPINNLELLRLLNKKCIVITHHGSVGLEMAHNNFKIISSTCNFYEKKFKVCNAWSSKKEYIKLLEKEWSELKSANKEHLYSLTHDLLLSKKGYFGGNYHENVLGRYIKKKFKNKYNKKGKLFDKENMYLIKFYNKLNLREKEKISKNIKLDIQYVN